MSDLKIEVLPIEQIIPYENNAKLHPQEEIAKLALSIERFGWDQPIVVDSDMVIIKGHGRRLAALELGMKKVPVLVRRDLTKAEADAARLSDNHVTGKSYDTELMQLEMAALKESGELDLLGSIFEDKELSFLGDDSIDMVDDSAFADDIEQAIKDQETQDEKTTEELETREVSVAKALGFSKVPGGWERQIERFMSMIEKDSGLKGRDAFYKFVSEACG